MKFLTKRVAIGDSSDAHTESALKLSGITAILNVAIDLESPPTTCVSKKAGLVCGPGTTPAMIQKVVEIGYDLLRHHERILIYGHAGKTRAPLAAAALKSHVGKMFDDSTFRRKGPNIEKSIDWVNEKVEIEYASTIVKEALLKAFGKWQTEQNLGTDTVSIIMPFFKNLDITRKCVDSIRDTTIYSPYEIIAVNDGSPKNPDLESYINENVDIIINHAENRGVAAARNSGIDASSGDYICQIDNDVVFTWGWLTNLMETLRSEKEVRIATPLFSFDHAHYLLNRNEFLEHRKFKEKETAPWVFLSEYAYASCMLFEKSLLLDIGRFKVGLRNVWEDRDLCFRLCSFMPDTKIAIDSRVVLYHSGPDEIQSRTISLPEIQDPQKDLEAMKMIKAEWNIEHPRYQELIKLHESDEVEPA